MNKRKRYMKRRLTKAYKNGNLNYDWGQPIQIISSEDIVLTHFDRMQKQINSLEKAVKKISGNNS